MRHSNHHIGVTRMRPLAERVSPTEAKYRAQRCGVAHCLRTYSARPSSARSLAILTGVRRHTFFDIIISHITPPIISISGLKVNNGTILFHNPPLAERTRSSREFICSCVTYLPNAKRALPLACLITARRSHSSLGFVNCGILRGICTLICDVFSVSSILLKLSMRSSPPSNI